MEVESWNLHPTASLEIPAPSLPNTQPGAELREFSGGSTGDSPPPIPTTQNCSSGSLRLVSDWSLRGHFPPVDLRGQPCQLLLRTIHVSGIYHSIQSHSCFLTGPLLCVMKAISSLSSGEEGLPLICPLFTSLKLQSGCPHPQSSCVSGQS